MRISIDSTDTSEGPISELLRLQNEFYTRLTEETLRYLRRLQGAAAPAVPGTVLRPDQNTALCASGSLGTFAELTLEIENRQRVHCVITPLVSPLVSSSGVTWFPAAEPMPPLLLIAPSEFAQLLIKLPLPATLTPGDYRGAIFLQGVRSGTIAVTITVTGLNVGEAEKAIHAEVHTATAGTAAFEAAAKPRSSRRPAMKKNVASTRKQQAPRRRR